MDEFGEFYLSGRDRILRTVQAASDDPAGAEDAVAEAYARALARWPRLRTHPNPAGWVVVTALNVQRSWWRRRRRESGELDPQYLSPEAVPTGLTPGLRQMVRALPQRQRQVVALRLIADLSAQEVGHLLGISAATVHVHLHRALVALRAGLGVTAGEPELTEAGREHGDPRAAVALTDGGTA
jgi:RNA polymerase sigma-70 factor (ECF subfamily)